jgi:integrase
LNVEELLILSDAIDPNYRAMVILSGVVGLRFGECAGLRVGRVDFLRRTVKIAETINEVGSEIVYGAPKTEASGGRCRCRQS